LLLRPDLGPAPRLGYVDSVFERAADRRTDSSFLDTKERAADAGAYLIGGELIVLKKTATGHEAMFTPDAARQLGRITERVFLGLLGEAGRFGLGLAPEAAEALKGNSDFHVSDLRSIAIQKLVEHEHLTAIAEAKALLHWHARHQRCSQCGGTTDATQGGWRRDCPHCKAQHFPRTDPVVIMLAVNGDQCLLGRQARFPPGMYSCLAGFVEPGESIEEAVRRETHEEAGIACGRVRYFASQPWPFPSSLMIGCHAEALSHQVTVDRDELEDARWFTRDEVVAMLMRKHPDGLSTPPPVAIAHHIIRAWAEHGDGVLA
jgi:NAD+ diphosphatase